LTAETYVSELDGTSSNAKMKGANQTDQTDRKVKFPTRVPVISRLLKYVLVLPNGFCPLLCLLDGVTFAYARFPEKHKTRSREQLVKPNGIGFPLARQTLIFCGWLQKSVRIETECAITWDPEAFPIVSGCRHCDS